MLCYIKLFVFFTQVGCIHPGSLAVHCNIMGKTTAIIVVVIMCLTVLGTISHLEEKNIISNAFMYAYDSQISYQSKTTPDRNMRNVSGIIVKSQSRDTEKLTSFRDDDKDVKQKQMSSLSNNPKRTQHSPELNQISTVVKNVTTAKPCTFIYSEDTLVSIIQKHRKDSGYMPPQNEICKKRVPKCIIVGVKKSGTRELIDFMNLHPNIVIKTNPYELGYFAQNYYQNNTKGTEWYRNQMPCSFSNQITVTKYPWYFSRPLAAKRIYSFDKEMKLIVLVREPVERLVSGFTFKFGRRDPSKVPPIEDHILLKNGDIDTNFEEVNLSSYDIALKNYLKYFKLNQILIIELNEFKSNPHQVLQRVESFLGLQHNISAENFVYNREKQFYCVKYHEKGYCYGNDRGRVKQPQLAGDIRKKLNIYFRSHNEFFFDIIGKRYDW